MNCPKCGVTLNLDLAMAETATPPPRPALPFPNPPRSPAPQSSSDLGALLRRVDVNVLDEKERQFVEETERRYRQYGPNTRMSEKQLAWLRKIAEKYAA